jgi:anti-sigma factor RsiW
MFGHLKNEEFMEIIESDSASTEQKAHLDSCPECASNLKSTASIHSGFFAMEADIPEPNWDDFRFAVRNGLLSRSIQRQSVVRRWTGWPLRSSLAAALSLVIVAALSLGGFLWHLERDVTNRAAAEKIAVQPSATASVDVVGVNDAPAADSDLPSWSHEDPFEELSQVSDAQVPELRQLIQSALSAQGGTLQRQ